MKNALLIGVCLLLLVTGCTADNALKNGDFTQADAADPTLPANWSVPEGSNWELANVGPNGEQCLALKTEGGLLAPIRQRCDFLTPGALYEVRATVRSISLTPVIVAKDLAEQKELGRASGVSNGRWREVGTRFEAITAEAAIEVFADGTHYKGEESGAGEVWLAQVEVIKIADTAPALELPDLGENIALGADYEMSPANYGYTRDDGDVTQLTDGVYTEGHFWTRPTTVGWSGVGTKHVRLDLGEVQPIKGISFSTAAGVADVSWPLSIVIFVSDDGEAWYEVGDLVGLSAMREALPPYGGYANAFIWSDALRTHGRYVDLYMVPGGGFTFCDEIEVFRGEDAWLAEAREVDPITGLEQHMSDIVTTGLVKQQFRWDLEAVTKDIETLVGGAKMVLSRKADDLAAEIEDMRPIEMANFRAVLPMTDLEREIFELQAEVWRVGMRPDLRVWQQNRWDRLAPSAEPESDTPPALSVHMMTNEYRADVLNFTNATDEVMQLRLTVTGLPGGDDPDYLTVHKVEHVGTRHFTSVAAALPVAERDGDAWLVDVPSGMTRQVWLAFNRPDVPADTYAGTVQIAGGGDPVSVPLGLRIYPLRFPDETTLLVGGWAYTDKDSQYGITAENRMAVIGDLQDHYVNAPWATSSSIPEGAYDDQATMTTEPNTISFDAWVATWPDAKMYMAFMAKNPGSTFAGETAGTEMFNKKLGEWAKFWAQHMRDLGLEPSQLALLIVDEPHGQEQYDEIVMWARAIEAAAPELVTWEDPQPTDPDTPREMFQTVDVLCPYRHNYLTRPQWYKDLLAEMQAGGTELWFYNANGPARTFDPFSFYLMQEWHAFAIGAKGSAFWAFGDNGRVSCWNEYPAQGNGPYCPTYLDETSVTAAKYMEAIREGIEDYEYLTMLAARVAELEAKGVAAGKLAAAKALLVSGPERVMAMDQGANYRWDEEKDRAVQDRVRVELLEALVELAGL